VRRRRLRRLVRHVRGRLDLLRDGHLRRTAASSTASSTATATATPATATSATATATATAAPATSTSAPTGVAGVR
jgi:hypothetical protein